MTERRSRWTIGVTGASGMKYALRLIEVLSGQGIESHVVFSEAALRVLAEEEGKKLSSAKFKSENLFGRELPHITFYSHRDIGAAIASGSFVTEGMVICPCSMGTLGAVASGLSQNLVQRAADVTLKEGRKLIIVPRETPLSAIHLENMLKLSKLGVKICPAMPGFYHKPKSIEDLVDMQVMKILDQMGVNSDLVRRWGQSEVVRVAPSNVRKLPTRLTRRVIELNREI